MLVRGEDVTKCPESITAVLSGEVALNTCSQRGIEAPTSFPLDVFLGVSLLSVAEPGMQTVLKKSAPSVWTDAFEAGLSGLKDAVYSAPVLLITGELTGQTRT